MEFILIQKDTPEWDFMWEWIANHPINKELPDPSEALNNNESWQYMGSYKHRGKVISSFRHRSHPSTNNVLSMSVEHIEFNDNCILPK